MLTIGERLWILLIGKRQEYSYVEFFAGVGNIHRVMRATGHKAVRFDMVDGKHRRGTNFMDLQTDAGFALLGLFP